MDSRVTGVPTFGDYYLEFSIYDSMAALTLQANLSVCPNTEYRLAGYGQTETNSATIIRPICQLIICEPFSDQCTDFVSISKDEYTNASGTITTLATQTVAQFQIIVECPGDNDTYVNTIYLDQFTMTTLT